MLVIVNDPTGTHKTKPVPLDCSVSLHENVARVLDAGADYEVWLNGVRVDDPASTLTRGATVADQLTLVRRPDGIEAIIIGAIIAATAVIVALMPKPPSLSSDGANAQDSPNNRLTGQTNVARAYEAIPDVFGKVRCWPDLIQSSSFEYVNNIKRVTEWLLVSRGRGSIESLKYADTPLTDIQESVYQVFEPTQGADGLYESGQTTITDVLETFDSAEVNGQEIEYPNKRVSKYGYITWLSAGTTKTFVTPIAVEWEEIVPLAGTGAVFSLQSDNFTGLTSAANHTLTSVTTDSVNHTFVFTVVTGTNGGFGYTSYGGTLNVTPVSPTVVTPVGPFTLQIPGDRLVWHYQYQRGLKGTVQIKATWWAIDDDDVEIPGSRQDQTDTMTADSFNPQFFTFSAIPSAGLYRYKFKFERLTSQIGSDGFDVCKLEEVSSGRFFSRKTYPGCTILKIVTTATAQATGFSERKFNCEFTRHVLQFGTNLHSPSRNFGRAIYHQWLMHGQNPDHLDIESIQAVNDAHGEDSELLRFDYTYSDKNMSLGERIQVAADHARCFVYRDGNEWVTVRDELRTLGATRQFDYRNLAASGDSTISESGHLPSSEDGVEVEFVHQDGKSKDYVRLRVSEDGTVSEMSSNAPRKVKMPGCRTRSQALNRAHLEARKIVYQRRRVSDTALMDAATMGIGELVRWIDPNDFLGDDGLQGGEVLEIDGSTIKTSERLDFKGEASGRIVFTTVDGTGTAIVTCTPRSDGVDGCVLGSVPSGLFVADLERQCGSRYAFGPGFTESELENAGLYTLESKRPDGKGRIQIDLASYDSRMYEMD